MIGGQGVVFESDDGHGREVEDDGCRLRRGEGRLGEIDDGIGIVRRIARDDGQAMVQREIREGVRKERQASQCVEGEENLNVRTRTRLMEMIEDVRFEAEARAERLYGEIEDRVRVCDRFCGFAYR